MRSKILVSLTLMLFFGTMTAGNLRIISPNGGEILSKTKPVQIKWEAPAVDGKVLITLYKKGIKISTITIGTPNTGEYKWRIPAQIVPHENYRIRIRSIQNLGINDFSDKDFAIVP
jgi:hypothetical protein